ncbi:unnamed protein product [Prunus brigantina]
MNPPSPIATDGPILGLVGRENPAVPPGTPRVETPGRQGTLEDRMETLQREMTKMQEHNHILSSKLDDTQKQLHEQQSRSAQLQDGLEQTTQLRQERPLKSISKPNDQRAEKQPAQDGPSASRRLFIPTSAECHEEYQVYSDCRDRINARRRERQTTPIPIQTQPNDRHLDVLGPKSPLRRSRRHTDRLEGTIGDNDVRRQATRHKDARINSQPAPKRQSPSEPTSLQPILDSASSFKKSIGSRKSRIRSEHQPGEKYNRDHSPAESDSTDLIKRYRPSESLSTQEWRTLSPISIHSNRLWTDRLYSADDLYTIRQGDSEPLREYAARFNHEYSRCPETNDRATFGAFKSGL